MISRSPLFLLVPSLAVFFGCSIGVSSTTVSIDLSTQRYLGQESELSRDKYFNIHANPAYGPIEMADHKFLREYGVGFGRGFNGPFWYHPQDEFPDSPFLSDAQAAALSVAVNDLYETQVTYPYRDRRLVVTDHPYQSFSMEMDLEAAADWTVSFFRHFFNDETRPLFYEPMNEPFVHAGDFGSDDAAVRLRMSELYREIGKAFDESGLDVDVIGYASAWPSMELNDFWHWDTRMKLFMDTAGEFMDGFSTHLYDGTNVTGQDNRRSGSNSEAILDLIETYSFIKWGKVKPHAITEFGDIPKGYPEHYTPEKSSQEHRAYNHILFNLFERQDRLMIAVPFITSKSPWFYEESGTIEAYLADLWRPDPESLENGQVRNYFFTKKIDFYKLWKGVHGERTVAYSDNPDVAVATFVEGSEVFVCLNNLDDLATTVLLQNSHESGALKSARIRRLNVPPTKEGIYTDEALQEELNEVTLQPYETVILCYDYEEPLVFENQVISETHYSKTHLVPIKAEQILSFEFENVPSDVVRASLRMSIGRKPEKSKQPIVKVNGQTVEVPANWPGYDQGNRKDFFGAIPIPLPTDCLKSKTTVELIFPDDGGRVSSLLLLTDASK